MSFKAGLLLFALLVGSHAFPASSKQDMSILFDHTDLNARIVGGTPAGQVPYMVALITGIYVRNLLCGGSLVTTRHVLTAAHCIAAGTTGNNLVSSLRGFVDTNRFESGGTPYPITRSIVHANYVPSTLKNDIGLLITSTNVVLTSSVSLVAMNFDFVGDGVSTTATGWGRISGGWNVALSQVLLTLSGTVVDGEECRTRVAERASEVNANVPQVDPVVELCSFHSDGRGMCNGDSGGPLMRSDRNQQIGIVSWGIPCALNAPDVFVRLSHYRSWIEQNTQ